MSCVVKFRIWKSYRYQLLANGQTENKVSFGEVLILVIFTKKPVESLWHEPC